MNGGCVVWLLPTGDGSPFIFPSPLEQHFDKRYGQKLLLLTYVSVLVHFWCGLSSICSPIRKKSSRLLFNIKCDFHKLHIFGFWEHSDVWWERLRCSKIRQWNDPSIFASCRHYLLGQEFLIDSTFNVFLGTFQFLNGDLLDGPWAREKTAISRSCLLNIKLCLFCK